MAIKSEHRKRLNKIMSRMCGTLLSAKRFLAMGARRRGSALFIGVSHNERLEAGLLAVIYSTSLELR